MEEILSSFFVVFFEDDEVQKFVIFKNKDFFEAVENLVEKVENLWKIMYNCGKPCGKLVKNFAEREIFLFYF